VGSGGHTYPRGLASRNTALSAFGENPSTPNHVLALRRKLAAPIDGASIAVFRIAFFLIIACEVGRYFAHDWIREYWIAPPFHFSYFGFEWLKPWPGAGMYIHFALLGLLALIAAAGLWYRPAAILVWLGFTYQFLLDEARYLNHFYAASLLALLLAVIPANAAWSLHFGRSQPHSEDAGARTPETVPLWTVWLLRAQVGIMYVYAGLAKLNGDWLHGEPMHTWLVEKSSLPLIGMIVRHGWELAIFSYGGLFFDILVVPGLLWRRTRPYAFCVAVAFHVINSQLFSIGIFPWMMIAATTVFFDPDWPRRLRDLVTKRPQHPSVPVQSAIGVRPLSRLALGTLVAYLIVQIAVPIRHVLYPGNVAWTEEGHRFSWRMMLRDKRGTARFVVDTPEGQVTVFPQDSLTRWQYDALVSHPDMILQFAHHLAEGWRKRGVDQVQVRAIVTASLDQHREMPLVDSTVDLASQPRTLLHESWVTVGPR
jgi:vitamin K-dependent gamma-carboxylase